MTLGAREGIPRALFGVCLAPLLACASCALGRSQAEAERDLATRLTPAAPAPQIPAPARPVELRRVRIWADRDFRSRNFRWEKKAHDLVESANGSMVPWFGVRLVVTDTRPWDRSGTGADLGEALDQLRNLDGGNDVDWVLGLVTDESVVATARNVLGIAAPLSRHFLLRSMEDRAERKTLDRSLGTRSGEEREQVYRARKAHKEVMVFIHEWAHTMGAIHVRTPGDLMSSDYGDDLRLVSGANLGLIELGLRHRAARGADAAADLAYRKELLALLGSTTDPDWNQDERAELIARARGDAPAGPSGGRRLSPAVAAVYNRAVDHARAARWREAWQTLLPLVDKNLDQVMVLELACSVAKRGGAEVALAERVCRRAAELSTDTGPLVDLSFLLLDTGRRPESRKAADEARGRLEGKGGDPAAWGNLGIAYHRLDLVTHAEHCAARAGGLPVVGEIGRWAARVRRDVGLPLDAGRFGVAPDREDEYVGAMQECVERLARGDLKAARSKAGELKSRFPGAPGPHLVLCEVELKERQPQASRESCARALAAFDALPRAHYLAAHGLMAASDNDGAIRHFRRAIELEPAFKGGWRDLAELLAARKDAPALADLKRAYERQFSAKME